MSALVLPYIEFPDALLDGTVLGDFTITRVIGLGGFGIVYMAHDNVLHRTVAVKEYLPITIAGRARDMTVLVRSTRQADTYIAGLQSFMREARLQARFTHPAMLEVYQVWEQNGTAYMAMRYYPGESLLDLREDPDSGMVFDEDAIRRIMAPVFEGVAVLHTQNVLHRDVSPDNILIMPSGAPVLLDFGSARTVVVGDEQSLTTVLKPGYAPVEQYIDDGTMEQGPWTDVYALGAVLYFLAMGTPPPQAVTRMLGGTLHEFEAAAQGRYSAAFISAVTASMTVQPTMRLQSVDALREALGWPDEPAADNVKSMLVATLNVPFNAEWRAAQIAARAPSIWATPSVASDAVTVLVSEPMAHIAHIAPAPSPPPASPAPASPSPTAAPFEFASRVPVDPALDDGSTRATRAPASVGGQTKNALALALRPQWLAAASIVMLALGLITAAQPTRPVSTAVAPQLDLPPALKLTATLPSRDSSPPATSATAPAPAASTALAADSTTKVAPVARPRIASAKKREEVVATKDSVASLVTAAPAATIPTAVPVTPTAASRPGPPRQKSAACQRQLSKLAPSEAAIAHGDSGPLVDCK